MDIIVSIFFEKASPILQKTENFSAAYAAQRSQPRGKGIGQGGEALEAERFAADIGGQAAYGWHAGPLSDRRLRMA